MGETEAERAWRTMHDLVHGDDRRGEVSEALGLSFARVKVLCRVAVRPQTGRELATLLASDPPFVSVLVDDLEQRGLVARGPHPTDRRSKLVTATAAGKRAAAKANRIISRPPAGMLALGEDDLAELVRLIALVAPPAVEE